MPYLSRLIILLLTLFPVSLLAQNSETDSLLNVLSHAKNDKNKAGLYLAVAESIEDIYPDSALKYVQEATLIAGRTGDKELLASSFRHTGLVLGRKSEYQKALSHFNRALSMYTELKDRENTAVVYNNMSSAFYYLNKYDEAFDYGSQSP